LKLTDPVLSVVCTKIAGAVPTAVCLQVLESKMRKVEKATECPYPVEESCPHTGSEKHRLLRSVFRSLVSGGVRVSRLDGHSQIRRWSKISGYFRISLRFILVGWMLYGVLKGQHTKK